MIYILLGEDREAKEQKITEIKTKHLTSPDALKLDYELLYGKKLEPAALKKAITAHPGVAPKRLILIRQFDKLITANKNLLLDFAPRADLPAVLILDSDEVNIKNAFFSKLLLSARVMRFAGRKKQSVFDMTRALENRSPEQALKILSALLNDGNHPLLIMGGMVWFWGTLKRRLSAGRFQQGLAVLQEADLNIKRSRLNPEYAVEVAVTKLNLLIAC